MAAGGRGRAPRTGHRDRHRRHRARPGVRGPYGDWAGLRETGDGGALLARPDNYIGFRHATASPDAADLLTGALRQILGRARPAPPEEAG
ncbi:hypothetical protein [Streptomyces sp. NPDC021212]|uniref:aromatic-ring hydroxylase C-terminal domain-containing protein n=1 Tax=Streptomyces sp. NPDC021212 TaxID=3365118 RepID=UPI00378FD2C8